MKKVLLAVLAMSFVGFMAAPVLADDPPPVYSINPCNGANVNMGGTTNVEYKDQSPPTNTTYNGTSFKSTAPNSATSDHAVKLGGDTVPAKLCIGGPVIDGSFPQTGNGTTWTWDYMHSTVGGYGLQLFSLNIRATDMRIDNVEDGIKLQNCAEDAPGGGTTCDAQQPGGRWTVDGMYMTNIRDDSLDNDDCLPGDIDDSLFDGVHTFYSEQEESSSTGDCVGDLEDHTTSMTNLIVRLDQTNADADADPIDGPGKWFKCQGTHEHHDLSLSNVVLAVDEMPRSGWDSLDMCGAGGTPPSTTTTWLPHSGNIILYLGDDTYGGPRPRDTNGDLIPFQTGSQARATYGSRRNTWLTQHHYDTIPASDLNQFNDPVERHGAK